MILLTPPRRAAVFALATLVELPATLCAEANTPNTMTAVPSQQELARFSPAGNYLAARHAGTERDAVSASAYYRAALRADPKNPVLLERAFLSVLVDGEIDEAVKLAERMVQFDKTHRVARLVLGVRALRFVKAESVQAVLGDRLRQDAVAGDARLKFHSEREVPIRGIKGLVTVYTLSRS